MLWCKQVQDLKSYLNIYPFEQHKFGNIVFSNFLLIFSYPTANSIPFHASHIASHRRPSTPPLTRPSTPHPLTCQSTPPPPYTSMDPPYTSIDPPPLTRPSTPPPHLIRLSRFLINLCNILFTLLNLHKLYSHQPSCLTLMSGEEFRGRRRRSEEPQFKEPQFTEPQFKVPQFRGPHFK